MNPAMPALAVTAFLIATPAWAQLPEGPGKALVETRCVGCHDLSNVTRSGYTRAKRAANIPPVEWPITATRWTPSESRSFAVFAASR